MCVCLAIWRCSPTAPGFAQFVSEFSNSSLCSTNCDSDLLAKNSFPAQRPAFIQFERPIRVTWKFSLFIFLLLLELLNDFLEIYTGGLFGGFHKSRIDPQISETENLQTRTMPGKSSQTSNRTFSLAVLNEQFWTNSKRSSEKRRSDEILKLVNF